jgi:hypothetical protein
VIATTALAVLVALLPALAPTLAFGNISVE